ncbi:MAG TPA: PAS domain-containing protein [Caulobacteraceae bacterium]|nr:PAS domain-containing protein [Caulobacteraceae bacterium]
MYASADEILDRALTAVLAGELALQEALDELPSPIYMADPNGVITYFNRACIDFTGRRPEAGADRWCVTWRLYTNAGEFLPHDECPMAVAINSQKPVRGVTAVAERPDGTRVVFRPYPTPIFDEQGAFAGAINLLEDVTDEIRGADFLAQAARCRRLASHVLDQLASEALNRLAAEYEAKALALGAFPAEVQQAKR